VPKNKASIVFLTTYPPRECGIASFTQDLFKSCQKILGATYRSRVAAFNLSPLDTYKYPREVVWEIDQNSNKDYLDLARIMNLDPEIAGVIIQHEYGIFGGLEGEKILHFMEKCKKPILVTLHTALPTPSVKMKDVTEKIINLASSVVVLTKNSKEIMETVYPSVSGKIFVIPHGIHSTSFSFKNHYKEKLELEGHTVLSTFGLLSRGKGVEFVIRSLPEVIKKYPDVVYLVLGETHPVILRNEGEKYRLELGQLVKSLNLEKHVRFYNQYLELPDLLEFLQATDIYISSSINLNQAVSGTLSYALGAGKAVISTEFAQAKEIVTPDIGRLVPVKDSKALTLSICDLLSNKEKLKDMSKKAFDKTRSMLWSNVALKYTNLLMRTIVPPLDLKHLFKMTDKKGLFQFANLDVPNHDSGYTLDDNARALIFCSLQVRKKHNKKLTSLINIYFSFIKSCQLEDGSFINYVNFGGKAGMEQNRREDLEDSHARAVFALSEVMSNKKLSYSLRILAKKMFVLSLKRSLNLSHLRAQALMIKSFGLTFPMFPEKKDELLETVKKYADFLCQALKKNSHKTWFWFEKDLNYSNALLPEALFIAGKILNNSSYIEKAIRSLDFLISKTFSPDMYIPIGQSSWYTNDEKRSQFDQQPEDPASMILALFTAYSIIKREEYRNLIKKCFSWFLGNNNLNESLYNEKTGGCYDGLHPDRVNQNQGAESLISYLMSNFIVTQL
jgi:glycosyltransferase involved in cell wall biosynthesis